MAGAALLGRLSWQPADVVDIAVESGSLDTDTALRELVERVAEVTERIRARMDRLGELDLASQDVLIEVVRELEKQLWMLRASLPAQAQQ